MIRFPNSKKMVKELQQQAEKLEGEMKYEVNAIKKSSAKALGVTLTIAAGGLMAALVYRMLSGKEEEHQPQIIVEKKIKRTPVPQESLVKSRIKSAVIALLVEVAKKKLISTLNKKLDDSEPSE